MDETLIAHSLQHHIRYSSYVPLPWQPHPTSSNSAFPPYVVFAGGREALMDDNRLYMMDEALIVPSLPQHIQYYSSFVPSIPLPWQPYPSSSNAAFNHTRYSSSVPPPWQPHPSSFNAAFNPLAVFARRREDERIYVQDETLIVPTLPQRASEYSYYVPPPRQRQRLMQRERQRFRQRHPSRNGHGYEIPPRMRRHGQLDPHEESQFNSETLQIQDLMPIDNEWNPPRVSGLSEKQISKFLISCLGCIRTEKEICTICQDEIQLKEGVITLKCFHIFHKSCIKRWLKIKNECPVCRTSVVPINSK